MKDIHRFSFSRLDTFKTCPRKHYYIYVEQLPEPQNEYALKGSLFHKAVSQILTGENPEETYKEYKQAVDTGIINAERDLLEYIVNLYFSYYYKDYNQEETIAVEHHMEEKLDEDDTMVTILDQAYRINGLVGIRDIKTTSGQLKYNIDTVRENMQLLTYAPKFEQDFNEKVDFIEIDEVRLAKLQTEVPLVSRGKPSKSMDALQLVLAETYRDELERQGLLEDEGYKVVLQKLIERGHPLFNRVKVQLQNRYLIDDNRNELMSLYVSASIGTNYRIKDQQKCFMCPYNRICSLDQHGGDSLNREKLIELLQ